MNVLEGVDSRLLRLKLETAVIEQHNARLENNKYSGLNKPAAHTVVDSEVCDLKLNQNTIHRIYKYCYSEWKLASTTLHSSVHVSHVHCTI